MRVELVRAWPRRFERIELDLPERACIADALRAADVDAGAACAVFGVSAGADTALHEGDRIELLRPLLIDPKEARRRRAGGQVR